MKLLKKITVIQMIIASFLIQFTAQQDITLGTKPRYHFDGTLIYGYPKPYIEADAFSFPRPVWHQGIETEPIPEMPLSVYLFAPAREIPRFWESRAYARNGIFLWEHYDFLECQQKDRNFPSFYDGVYIDSQVLPIPFHYQFLIDMNPGLPLTKVDSFPMQFIAWRCVLFNTCYFLGATVCGFYILNSSTCHRNRSFWSLVFIGMQLAIVISLAYSFAGGRSLYMIDCCWLYHVLYAINCLIIPVLFFCTGEWFLISLTWFIQKMKTITGN